MDSACGYEAMTLMPADASVLAIEDKVNFGSPAAGDRMTAQSHVTKPGRTATVCRGDVVARSVGQEKLVVTMLGTMMMLRNEQARGRY